MILAPRDVEIRHFHLFCGLGGGAKGFNRGRADVGHLGDDAAARVERRDARAQCDAGVGPANCDRVERSPR